MMLWLPYAVVVLPCGILFEPVCIQMRDGAGHKIPAPSLIPILSLVGMFYA